MEQEVETLVGLLANARSLQKAGSTYYEGTLDGLDVVVVQCGIGKVNAALCVQVLCDLEMTALTAARQKQKLAATEQCVVLEAWVPAERENRVSTALDKLPCA